MKELNERQHAIGQKVLELCGVDSHRDVCELVLRISWRDGTALLTTVEPIKDKSGKFVLTPDGKDVSMKVCGDSLEHAALPQFKWPREWNGVVVDDARSKIGLPPVERANLNNECSAKIVEQLRQDFSSMRYPGMAVEVPPQLPPDHPDFAEDWGHVPEPPSAAAETPAMVGVCPDCKGENVYRPLVGPPEPCRACCGGAR